MAAPENAWVVLRSPDPETLAVRLESTGYDDVAVFGPFVVARHPLRTHTTAAALKAGVRAYRVSHVLSPGVQDFGRLADIYRLARGEARAGVCPPAG